MSGCVRWRRPNDLPVLQHVGDAGRRARVILQDVKGFGVHPHDVDTCDVNINVMRNFLVVHFRTKYRIFKHQLSRNDASPDDVAQPVDVLDIEVEGFDALLKTATQKVPLRCRENPRDDVEGDETFLRFGIAVNGKGYTDAAEQEFSLALPEIQLLERDFTEPLREFGVSQPYRRRAGAFHLAESGCHRGSHRLRVARLRPAAHPLKGELAQGGADGSTRFPGIRATTLINF